MFGHGAGTFVLNEPALLAATYPQGRALRLGHGVPLDGRPLVFRVTHVRTGDILLHVTSSTPLAMLGTVPLSIVLLAWPLNGRGIMVLNGRPVGPSGVRAYGAGAEYEVSNPGHCTWVTMALPSATAGALLGRRSLPPALRPGSEATLCASPATLARAQEVARDVCKVTTEDPHAFDLEHAWRPLRSVLLMTADELLASPADNEPVRARLARQAHRRLVRLIDNRVTAAPSRTDSIGDLSRVLGVSERQIREAFSEVLDVSPSRYLRLRRLVLTRAALRSPGLSWPSVRAVALGHGFRHLGRFACIYHDAFGEAPSVTREAAVGRGAALVRRPAA
jgi:AraC-like DNA-binding protein